MKQVLLLGIKIYKIASSPFYFFSGPYFRCRYLPTCSEYAKEAINKYGAAKGLLLGIKRVARCNPLSMGGIDEVTD